MHSAKSFDSVLCSKSKTIMSLAIAHGQVNTVKCVSIYSLSLNSMSFSPLFSAFVVFRCNILWQKSQTVLLHFTNHGVMTLFLQGCLARQKKELDSIQPGHFTVFSAVNPDNNVPRYSRRASKYSQVCQCIVTSFQQPKIHGFISTGLFSKIEEETRFHLAKHLTVFSAVNPRQ